MSFKTEILNLITGLLLVACGVLNFIYAGDFVLGMNWIIFGSMYLVMDDYLQDPSRKSFFNKLTDISRNAFSWVGLLCSAILLFYYIELFLF